MKRCSTGDDMLSSPPGDIIVGVPSWDLAEVGKHDYTTLLRDAALLPTQVTHARSREDPKGNVATLRWNDFGPNGNLIT